MDKNYTDKTDKNIRILLAFLIVLTMSLVLAFLGMLMYSENAKSSYTVEYVGVDNKVLIQTYSRGEKVRLPNVPSKAGYEFIGWTLDSDATIWISDEYVVNQEITLYAQWQKKTCTIMYNNQSYIVDFETTIIVEDNYILFCDENHRMIKIENIDKVGYDIIGLKDNKGKNYFDDFIITEDVSLELCYQANDYTIVFPKSNGKFLIKYFGQYLINNSITKPYMESLEFEIELSTAYSNSIPMVYYYDNGKKIEAIQENNVYKFDCITNNINIYIDNININTYSLIVDDYNYGEYNYGSFITITDDGIRIQDDISGIVTNIPALYQNSFSGWRLQNGKILTNSSIQDLTTDDKIVLYGNYVIKNL